MPKFLARILGPSHTFSEFTFEDAARLVFGDDIANHVGFVEDRIEIAMASEKVVDLTAYGLPKDSFQLSPPNLQNRQDPITDQPDGLFYYEINGDVLMQTAELLRAQHEAAIGGLSTLEKVQGKPPSHLARLNTKYIGPEEAVKIVLGKEARTEVEANIMKSQPARIQVSLSDKDDPNYKKLSHSGLAKNAYMNLGRDPKNSGSFLYSIDFKTLNAIAAKKRQKNDDIIAAAAIMFGDGYSGYLDDAGYLNLTFKASWNNGIGFCHEYFNKDDQSQKITECTNWLKNNNIPSQYITTHLIAYDYIGSRPREIESSLGWQINGDALITAAQKKLKSLQR